MVGSARQGPGLEQEPRGERTWEGQQPGSVRGQLDRGLGWSKSLGGDMNMGGCKSLG